MWRKTPQYFDVIFQAGVFPSVNHFPLWSEHIPQEDLLHGASQFTGVKGEALGCWKSALVDVFFESAASCEAAPH